MCAKKATKDTIVHEEHVSPFEQISSLENEQETRVLQASERFEQEKREMEKSLHVAEKTQEEMERAKASDELKEYARTEPANILKNTEKETSEELASIAKHADKQLPKTLETILSPLLDGSVFKNAA